MFLRSVRWAMSVAGILTVVAKLATAQCPAVLSDSTCGTVITITDSGASISATGQGPYDLDDGDGTLVGVINNSSQPVYAIGLASNTLIFGFGFDGIDRFNIPGNNMDNTGYGGPNAYFANIDPTLTSGVVNFITPISARGGSSYFSLASVLASATACSSIINNAVSIPQGGGTQISSVFTPNHGYTLAQAAALCGFSNFDWQQLITSLPAPSPFYAASTFTNLLAPAPFNDPPPDGYSYQYPTPNAVGLPVYYNLATSASDPLSLAYNETATALYFFDAPADPCLPGGDGGYCGGNAPLGSYLAFSTHLVGIVGTPPNALVQDTGIGFNWTDTFNGTSGGIAVINSARPVDPHSGTGGITITAVNEQTSYQNPKNLAVKTINGTAASQGPRLTLLNSAQVSVTASGLAYSRATKTFTGTVTIKNIGGSLLTGPFQLVLLSLSNGATAANGTGVFGGSPYFTVRGPSSLPPGGSITLNVQFYNPSLAAIKFTPVVYIGGFN